MMQTAQQATKWLEVGELSAGFASDPNTLPFTDQLAGKQFDLHFDNGWQAHYHFIDNTTLQWQMLSAPHTSATIEEYSATTLREGIYFINFLPSNERASSISLVMNIHTGNATVLIGTLPNQEQLLTSAYQRVQENTSLTDVDITIYQARIDQPYDAQAGHSITDELIGQRIQYTYSPHETYEHIYLNQSYYTWQCLKGVEQGLADTDLCHYYKIAKQLYLFVWREKIIPTLGIVMIDLQQLKTSGKIFGYHDATLSQLNNFPVGAHAMVLNQTRHNIDK